MRWYYWLVLVVIVNVILLALVGAQYLPVGILGFLLALQVVVVKWVIAVWLIKRFLRWLFKKPASPTTTTLPPS